MTEEKPKTKICIDVTLESGFYEGALRNRLYARLTVPEKPDDAKNATMHPYAAEVLEPYTKRNGNGKPHYDLKVSVSHDDSCAVFEVLEPVNQNVLTSNFEAIVAVIKQRRTRPVAGIAYGHGTMHSERSGEWRNLYDIEVRVNGELI